VGELASRPAPTVEPGPGVSAFPRDDSEPVRPTPKGPADVVRDHRLADRPTFGSTGRTPSTVDHTTAVEPEQPDRELTDRPANGQTQDQEPHGPRTEPPFPAPIPGCTAPQLRRFIKSRPYVPMHELRRRFGINGSEDDVSSIDLGDRRRVYVGLPPREGSLLGELLRGGDIGFELSLDPRTPIVIGLYPMRPVARS
jgi:hypothetical protein